MQTAKESFHFAHHIEQIRQHLRIEEIAAAYNNLRPSGTILRGICPLPSHNDTTPSFTVYPGSQSFYCFGCRRSGDVFNLVMYREGFDFLETARFLVAKANIPVKELSEEHTALTHLTVDLNRDWYVNNRIHDPEIKMAD